jgi:hypothetical protein
MFTWHGCRGFFTSGAPLASARLSLRHHGSTPATCSPLSTAPTPPWLPHCWPTATARRRGTLARWRSSAPTGSPAPRTGAAPRPGTGAVQRGLRGGSVHVEARTFTRCGCIWVDSDFAITAVSTRGYPEKRGSDPPGPLAPYGPAPKLEARPGSAAGRDVSPRPSRPAVTLRQRPLDGPLPHGRRHRRPVPSQPQLDHSERCGRKRLIRCASPVYHLRRTATRDVELHGQRIRAGDRSSCSLPSGHPGTPPAGMDRPPILAGDPRRPFV